MRVLLRFQLPFQDHRLVRVGVGVKVQRLIVVALAPYDERLIAGTGRRLERPRRLSELMLIRRAKDLRGGGRRPDRPVRALRRRVGLLAAGRTDVAIDTRLKVWDYAPFKPMIEGAGGVLSDWQGRPITLDSGAQILAAGDPARHAEALALVQQRLTP